MAELFELFNSDQTPNTVEDFIGLAEASIKRGGYDNQQLALIYAAFCAAFNELVGGSGLPTSTVPCPLCATPMEPGDVADEELCCETCGEGR